MIYSIRVEFVTKLSIYAPGYILEFVNAFKGLNKKDNYPNLF